MKRVFILAAIMAAFVVSGCTFATGQRKFSVESQDIKASYESDTRTPEQKASTASDEQAQE